MVTVVVGVVVVGVVVDVIVAESFVCYKIEGISQAFRFQG